MCCAPWRHLSAIALGFVGLRLFCRCQVPEADSYGTHAFRRGHARVTPPLSVADRALYLQLRAWQDMLEKGASLAQILRAGQWRSAAFMRYLNENDIEKDAALEAAADTDDEQWID